FLRVVRGAFGHSPALERAIQFQPEIEMEPGRPVQLHHEAQRPAAFVLATFGFGRLLKLTFFAVFLERHGLNNWIALTGGDKYYHAASECDRGCLPRARYRGFGGTELKWAIGALNYVLGLR